MRVKRLKEKEDRRGAVVSHFFGSRRGRPISLKKNFTLFLPFSVAKMRLHASIAQRSACLLTSPRSRCVNQMKIKPRRKQWRNAEFCLLFVNFDDQANFFPNSDAAASLHKKKNKRIQQARNAAAPAAHGRKVPLQQQQEAKDRRRRPPGGSTSADYSGGIRGARCGGGRGRSNA